MASCRSCSGCTQRSVWAGWTDTAGHTSTHSSRRISGTLSGTSGSAASAYSAAPCPKRRLGLANDRCVSLSGSRPRREWRGLLPGAYLLDGVLWTPEPGADGAADAVDRPGSPVARAPPNQSIGSALPRTPGLFWVKICPPVFVSLAAEPYSTLTAPAPETLKTSSEGRRRQDRRSRPG